MAIANGLLLLVLWFSAGSMEQWLQATVLTRVGWLSLVVLAGVGVYFISLWLSGVRLQQLLHRPGKTSR